jgi:ferredoxin
MGSLRGTAIRILIILCFGLIPALLCKFLEDEPVDRHLHIRSFRYGKDPYVIRCNRGDRLHLTFSTEDTGHSFFLEEFDMDVKVSPGNQEVTVFKISDPAARPYITREVSFTAKHGGILNYLVSRSSYRCHVWCGPLHAFEQGKLVLLPNTLLFFSLGCSAGIIFLWLAGFLGKFPATEVPFMQKTKTNDLFMRYGFLKRLTVSRWPQIIITIVAMVMIYIVILTSTLGTKVSGRNLGVLMMWTIWLFLIVAVFTPFAGRSWCTICPLPFFGDLLQRRSVFTPAISKTGEYNNRFSGLFLKWPERLSNNWLKLFVFMVLATFSTTLVARPSTSGMTIILLLLIPTLMSMIWEHRAFCRYVCPVSVFVSPFSRMSFLALRTRSQQVCDKCKPHFCQKGNSDGWACPYGLNAGKINESSDCGLCLECLRSCTYNNVTLVKRPFASELGTRNISEAWLSIAIFSISIIYSIVYLGPWPVIREYINIIDKNNRDLFIFYSFAIWSLALIVMPGLFYLLSFAGQKMSKLNVSSKDIFLGFSGCLLPLGMMMWIAFVIPMLFVNITFIFQSVSDPFGWGWDFFGTANIPWHQFIPEAVPWLQGIMVISGLYLSIRNTSGVSSQFNTGRKERLLVSLPSVIFIFLISTCMLVFFTN